MELFYILIIFLLVLIILLLSAGIYYLIKNSIYLSDKEKEFIVFTMDIFIEYGEDLGIQSKEQHEKLVEELNKIKEKKIKRII